ncbi:SDR family oxidoreductase [Granulicella paludicola]|uniref:SDR family oxidoreductase n=1 Tax=Granulicella paludicola TaxID=474951 RepID=UPI0021E0AD41|nr:SDR family oxidoreductase [Granulicella paludicola]
MKMTGNTILITGGGSGIGRGLAEAFHNLGNEVIIAGRRKEVLEFTATANPGMKFVVADVDSPNAVKVFAEKIAADFPALNVLLNNAGIMRPEDFAADIVDVSTAEAEITTNILGPIRLTAALLPLLKKQKESAVLMVTSGLAFTPLAGAPTYCATKAAMHSFSQSLRYQLRETSVQVLELAPPYVQTELGGASQASDPRAMPLAEYISETMSLLAAPPASGEILVKRVEPLRWSEKNGNFEQVFGMLATMH